MPRVYHNWTADEEQYLAMLRCFTNATWTQTCTIMNESFGAAFSPALERNKAQEKFKDMRRRKVPMWRRVSGAQTADLTISSALDIWVAFGNEGYFGLAGLAIMDRRATAVCRDLPKRVQKKARVRAANKAQQAEQVVR